MKYFIYWKKENLIAGNNLEISQFLYAGVTICNPTNDTMSVLRKTMRHTVAGSEKIKMPNKTLHTAPIPAHTAYAVPTGIGLEPPIDL
jgi:hypothetical protein